MANSVGDALLVGSGLCGDTLRLSVFLSRNGIHSLTWTWTATVKLRLH